EFLNAPLTLNGHVAIYGYNRNVRFVGNYTQNWLCPNAMYIQQSDNVLVMGDQYRTTANQNAVAVKNSKDVSIVGCTTSLPTTAGDCVIIRDFGGTTFDAHTNLYNQSNNVRV